MSAIEHQFNKESEEENRELKDESSSVDYQFTDDARFDLADQYIGEDEFSGGQDRTPSDSRDVDSEDFQSVLAETLREDPELLDPAVNKALRSGKVTETESFQTALAKTLRNDPTILDPAVNKALTSEEVTETESFQTALITSVREMEIEKLIEVNIIKQLNKRFISQILFGFGVISLLTAVGAVVTGYLILGIILLTLPTAIAIAFWKNRE